MVGFSNLSGRWEGEYTYPNGVLPVTPFLAVLVDRNGHLSGSVVEPNTIAVGTLEARLAGTRDGVGVDFTKTYPACSGPDYANPVDYVGTISDEGNVIRGRWSILDIDGSFEMRREVETEVVGEVEYVEAPC